jgi:hypothetical protein
MTENTYNFANLVITGIIGLFAVIFGFLQILINYKLKKIQEYIALSIEPIPNVINRLKLVNTGKVNLYIHAFEINGKVEKFEPERLIPLNSFYWIYLPLNANSEEDISKLISESKEKFFQLKIYLANQFGHKYITEGSYEISEGKIFDLTTTAHIPIKSIPMINAWTNKTKKFKWKL